MPECIIGPATETDIQHVIAHLRPEHAKEIAGQANLSNADAIRLSVSDSCLVMAGRVNGITLFLCGVTKAYLLSDVGSVWMLATPEIDAYPLESAVALRELFNHAHELAGAEILEQFIPSWYLKGIKWLLWLGWKAVGTRMINGNAHIHMTHELEHTEWA